MRKAGESRSKFHHIIIQILRSREMLKQCETAIYESETWTHTKRNKNTILEISGSLYVWKKKQEGVELEIFSKYIDYMD
jgi:hypothetical protein